MARHQRSRIDWAPTAVAVRLVAFVVAAIGVLSIPAVIVADSTGALTHHTALIVAAAALAVVVTAALVVRPFDPLRG